MSPLHFRIGGGEHEYALVEVLASNGDGWLPSQVDIQVGAFRGRFNSNLDVWAFSRFAKEVRDLHQALRGTATFTTYEKQLELSLVGDGLGHITVNAEAMDYVGTGNRLTFQLHLDQTELPTLLTELDKIVSTYPAA